MIYVSMRKFLYSLLTESKTSHMGHVNRSKRNIFTFRKNTLHMLSKSFHRKKAPWPKSIFVVHFILSHQQGPFFWQLVPQSTCQKCVIGQRNKILWQCPSDNWTAHQPPIVLTSECYSYWINYQAVINLTAS